MIRLIGVVDDDGVIVYAWRSAPYVIKVL